MSIFLMVGLTVGLKNVDGFDVMSVSEKSPIGYFFEVDLEYPDELHELHTWITWISNDRLSKYCKNIADKYEIKVGEKINFKFR